MSVPTSTPASTRAVRLPRDLHPVAWWVWAIGVAAAASSTTNPFALLLMVAVVVWVVAARRGDHPWARAFRLYLWFGLFVVVMRVFFRVLLSGGLGTVVWLDLPEIPLPDWVAGVTLLGPVTRESVLAGLYEGMRLATIIICVGAANSLANPKRLLKSVPPALYEIGTAIVVAVTVVPQLADSVQRVRRARALRGGEPGRVRGLRRIVVPVLEDALSRSMRLAAGMDTRGYGRAGVATAAQRRTTGVLMLAGLLGLCVGVYAVLDQTAPRYLAMPMVVGGCVVALAGFVSAGRRVQRTRYRPDRWRGPELGVVACGVVLAASMVWLARVEPMVAYPDLTRTPVVSTGMLLVILLAAVPGVLAPPAPTGAVKPA